MADEELVHKKCVPCKGLTQPLSRDAAEKFLRDVPGWDLEGGEIRRTFRFRNYYETVSFINAAAWIAHQEDHHPDISFSYRQCTVRLTTHAIRGLSENDFICAAKINRLLPADPSESSREP
ncbi:MAG: 4a-hydroxytetrahydrobiopterin dehydratase [Candidatus Omnitrophica bacterium]|nr:4a-hydroxytetrahydrobiopterin dehydratase [Candidatus Omnitrophota bacterium]